MEIEEQIRDYISSQPGPKRDELQSLHERMLQLMPSSKLWFLDGKNEQGKVVSNPNIGYGSLNLKYNDGSTREFYQIGLSANTGGISVYIMGLQDKTFLSKTYGNSIGKAIVTGYCIKFKNLKDVHMDILEAAILQGQEQAS